MKVLQTTIRERRPLEIYIVSSSLFIRHYWGNHIHFLFLGLLICLNSARSLVSLHALNKVYKRVNCDLALGFKNLQNQI